MQALIYKALGVLAKALATMQDYPIDVIQLITAVLIGLLNARKSQQP